MPHFSVVIQVVVKSSVLSLLFSFFFKFVSYCCHLHISDHFLETNSHNCHFCSTLRQSFTNWLLRQRVLDRLNVLCHRLSWLAIDYHHEVVLFECLKPITMGLYSFKCVQQCIHCSHLSTYSHITTPSFPL